MGLVSAVVIAAPFFFVGSVLDSTFDIFIEELSTVSYFLTSSFVGFIFSLFMTLIMMGFYELGKKLDTLSKEGGEK